MKLFRPFVLTFLIVLLASLAPVAAFAQTRRSLPPTPPPPADTVSVYTTAKATGQRIAAAGKSRFAEKPQPVESEISVFINPGRSFQTFLGIGGAFTDAAADTFAKLPADKQEEFVRAYYSRTDGIGYTLGRTTIHSSDFSSGSYTYVDENDAALKSFTLAHELERRIPLIKRATAMAGGSLTLFASPWSPPAFMKTNGSMLRGGSLKPEFRQAWADYFVRYVRGMEKLGIPIWGVSVQNEPMATQSWESCIYSAEQERDFLKNFLGPTLWKSGLKDKKIIVWDHNRDLITHRASTILDDPAAAKYVWGIGYHWYETWAGGQPMFENVEAVHAMYPQVNLLFTEGTVERFDPAKLQLWENGERYGRSMINDFNNGTVGWTDWNLLLDEKGGPNHVGNFCFAPIHADTGKGTIEYTPSYYYIGHFSKFIRPGAKRIAAAASRSQLLTTAFRNPDGTLVAVVMNESDAAVKYNFVIGTKSADIEIPARAIQTVVF